MTDSTLQEKIQSILFSQGWQHTPNHFFRYQDLARWCDRTVDEMKAIVAADDYSFEYIYEEVRKRRLGLVGNEFVWLATWSPPLYTFTPFHSVALETVSINVSE